jgi:hypothetical protein
MSYFPPCPKFLVGHPVHLYSGSPLTNRGNDTLYGLFTVRQQIRIDTLSYRALHCSCTSAVRYPYLTLKKRITKTKTKDTLLAAIRGKLCIRNPYTIQRNIPAPIIRNIKREMSLASFILHNFMTCGNNDAVVSTAATNPISVIPSGSIMKYYNSCLI